MAVASRWSLRLALTAILTMLFVAAPWGVRAQEIKLLALGDSLTAGYGLKREDGFVATLERALRAEGRAVTVIDGGVSGDTTAGGLERLDWMLADKPRAAIVALGGNDALRALPPDDTRANLLAIVRGLQAQGVKVLIAGMYAPRNLGPDYVRVFDAAFPAVARETGAALHPFFLEGVAGDPALNQADGIHPNPAGVEVMVRGVLPAVRALLTP